MRFMLLLLTRLALPSRPLSGRGFLRTGSRRTSDRSGSPATMLIAVVAGRTKEWPTVLLHVSVVTEK